MADPWQEALDLDDSDLSSLRPSKRHHPSSASQPPLRRCSFPQSSETSQNLLSESTSAPRLIPGPAGTVQTAMIRRRKHPNGAISGDDFELEMIPTQEYIRRAVEEGIEDDDDFTGDPWLGAVDFVRSQGLTDGDGAIGVPLSAIKSGFNMDKVSQVVAVVKSCTPNGLGGLKVTLKDPTGTIDATIHGKVITEGEFGKDIAVGAVIILRKVTVFSPSRSAHYINITVSNMVKVFPKNVSIPAKQHFVLPMIKDAVPVNVAGRSEELPIPPKPSSLTRGMTQEIMNSLIQKEPTKASSNVDEPAIRCKATINQNTASSKDQLMEPQDADDGTDEIAYETNKENSQAVDGKVLGESQSGNSAVHLNSESNKESGDAIGTKGKQPMDSRVLLPEWTDEQLDELFSAD